MDKDELPKGVTDIFKNKPKDRPLIVTVANDILAAQQLKDDAMLASIANENIFMAMLELIDALDHPLGMKNPNMRSALLLALSGLAITMATDIMHTLESSRVQLDSLELAYYENLIKLLVYYKEHGVLPNE